MQNLPRAAVKYLLQERITPRASAVVNLQTSTVFPVVGETAPVAGPLSLLIKCVSNKTSVRCAVGAGARGEASVKKNKKNSSEKSP